METETDSMYLNLYLYFQERQQKEEELKVKEAELLRGNPLLNNPVATFSVKRRSVCHFGTSIFFFFFVKLPCIL